jgi:hypothetical protein
MHTRNDTGQPFYIGKGNGKRAKQIHNRSKEWHSIADVSGFAVHILARWSLEADAYEHEKVVIASMKCIGLTLCNKTDGGGGMSGFKKSYTSPMSQSEKERRRIANLGQKRSAETKLLISEFRKSFKYSDEARKKMSESKRGKKRGQNVVEQVAQKLRGRQQSPEQIANAVSGRNKSLTAHSNNKSCGLRGVSFHRRTGKWCAAIRHNCKKYYLGLFPSAELAHQKYMEAKQSLHFLTIKE